MCSLKRFWCVHASILSTLIDKRLSARQLIVRSAFVCNQTAVRNRWNLLVIRKLWSQSYSSAIVLTIPSALHLYWHMKLHLLASWRWACAWSEIYCACVFLVIFCLNFSPYPGVSRTIPNDGVGSSWHQQSGNLHMAISHGIVQWGVVLKPWNIHQSPVVQKQGGHLHVTMVTGFVLGSRKLK